MTLEPGRSGKWSLSGQGPGRRLRVRSVKGQERGEMAVWATGGCASFPEKWVLRGRRPESVPQVTKRSGAWRDLFFDHDQKARSGAGVPFAFDCHPNDPGP